MSASLVGSEMCIRDRGRLSERSALPAAKPPHVEGQQVSLKQANARVGPVSYTHLTLPTICSV
eukprot:432067-Alexandrium_andersonii.AAC.1